MRRKVGLGREAKTCAPHKDGKESHDENTDFLTERSEQADELAERADADGGQVAPAEALTIKPSRKDMYASIECWAPFHAQLEDWNDRDEIAPREAVLFVQEKRGGKYYNAMIWMIRTNA